MNEYYPVNTFYLWVLSYLQFTAKHQAEVENNVVFLNFDYILN